MKKKIAKQWVEALRSGEYKQANGRLCDGGTKFCCLGVLTELFIQHKHENTKLGQYKYGWETSSITGRISFKGETALLHKEVKEWSGMDTLDGSLYDSTQLTRLNDDGYKFEQLANIIEERYKEL